MIKINSIILLVFMGMGVFSTQHIQAQDLKTAGAYSDFVVGELNKITAKNVAYISKSVHSDNDRKIEQKRQEVITQIASSYDQIAKIPGFNNDTRFRDDALEVLKLLKESYEVDFKEADDLEKTSQDTYELLEAYYKVRDKGEKKMDLAYKNLHKAHQSFAKSNNITLVESESDVSKMVEIIGQLNEYQRKISLAHFKADKANAAFWEASNAQNATTMESKRKALLAAATESLTKMGAIGAFRNDASYINSAKALLNFYKGMATNQYNELTKITAKKDKLTQAEVDKANKIINDYNTKSQKLVKQFNESNAALTQKNIPKID
jgi:hypothetical protein